MATGERQEDGVRAGVGTVTRPSPGGRPGAGPGVRPGLPRDQAPQAQPAAPAGQRGRRPRPPQDPGRRAEPQSVQARPAQPRPGQPRPAQPRPAQPRPVQPRSAEPRSSEPRSAEPRLGGAPWRVPPAVRATGREAARTAGQQTGIRAALPHRMPFMLLLCGLLGGALISALVISTTLAEGSFQISKLQNSTSTLARQKQVLQEAVAQQESPQVIAEQAAKLGLRRPQQLLFLDLKSGKTTSDGPTWPGAVNAPGYAP